MALILGLVPIEMKDLRFEYKTRNTFVYVFVIPRC